MRLFVIRHGQSDWNVAGKIQGGTDIPLNETGLQQANMLAVAMKEKGQCPDKIISSPLCRAQMTAAVLGRAFCLPVCTVDAFHELSFGKWEGLTWDEIKQAYPADFDAWDKDRGCVRTTGGESYMDLAARLIPAVRRIIGEETGDVAIVTHGAVIMALHVIYENVPFGRIDDVMKNITNSSVTVFDGALMESRLRSFELTELARYKREEI